MTIERIALALPVVTLVVLVAWIGLMALVMRFSDAAPAAVVPVPWLQGMVTWPDDTAILSANFWAVTLANRPGLAADFYDAGAWLVLPAGLTGCLPLNEAARAALVGSGV